MSLKTDNRLLSASSLASFRQQLQATFTATTTASDVLRGMPFTDFVHYLKIQNKNDEIVPLVLKPLQTRLLDELTNRTIIIKPRQIGVTTVVQAYVLWRLLSNPARFATMAHDQETTHRLRYMQSVYYDNLPDNLLVPRTTDNESFTRYANRSELTIATAGGKVKGRGGTYGGGFHGTEVAYWVNGRAIMAGLMQGIPRDALVVLESTTNGQSGYFFDLTQQALSGRNDFRVLFYEWWLDPDYAIPLLPGERIEPDADERALMTRHGLTLEQIKWRRWKIGEIGFDDFIQEYPEDIATAFRSSGGGLFTVAQSQLIDPDTAPTEPADGDEYVMAIDWGQDRDATAVCILNTTTFSEAGIYRFNQRSWAGMRDDIIALARHWNVSRIMAERNAMGSSQIEALAGDLESAGLRVAVDAFTTTQRSKDMLVKLMQRALTDDGLSLLDDKVAMQELHAYTATQSANLLWSYSAPAGGHDDTVIARMLAVYASTMTGSLFG